MSRSADPLLPVVRIGEVSCQDRPRRWLVEALWGASSVGVIGGAPKCLKTWLGLDLALSVATGTPCLGKYAVPEPGPVLAYLAEDALPVVRQRVEGMARHRGLALDQVEIHVITAPTLRLDRDRDRDRRQLMETAKRLRPRLLLLDPLVRLHALDENDAGEVAGLLAYIRALQRELDLSVILVHHTRKNGPGGVACGQSLRGSGDLHAFGDSNLYLRRVKNRLLLSSEHRAAAASPPVYLELAANAQTTHLEVLAGLQDEPAQSLPEQVLSLLADGQVLTPPGSARRFPYGTNAWVRPSTRWNAPATSAAPPAAGNGPADLPSTNDLRTVPFPLLEKKGTERSKARTSTQPTPSSHSQRETMPGIDFDGLRNQITMEQVLDLLGFEPIARRGEQWYGPCPLRHFHASVSPRSRCFSVNVARRVYFCHGCHRQGNHLTLWADFTGQPVYPAMLDLCRRLGREPPCIHRW